MRKSILLAIYLVSTIFAAAQNITLADYNRAASFLYRNINNKKAFNLNVIPNWFADSSGFSFIIQNKAGKNFQKIVFPGTKVEPLFDHERLAKAITSAQNKALSANNLPISRVSYIDKTHLTILFDNKQYTLDLTNYSLIPKEVVVENEMEAVSPDSSWVAYSTNHNLFVKSKKTGEVKQLSKNGKKNYEYASYYGWGDLIEGENGEREPHFTAQWSPDSKWIMTYICDLTKGQKMYLLDWSVDSLYRARLLSYYRGSPGDTDMVYMTPVIFNVETGEEIIMHQFRNVNATNYDWSDKPGILFFENQQRGYQQIDLYQYNAATKELSTLYTEKSKTNIDNYQSRYIKEWNKMLITSEKDGWRQLYLLDITDKTVQPITKGEYYVNNIQHIDLKTQTIFFTASGKEAGRNPYFQHLYKVKTDGKPALLLTPEDANHDIAMSADGKYFVDNYSTYNQPTTTVLREGGNGKILKEISKADISALQEMNYKFPVAFTAVARDGQTTIYGAIWKPSNFDPAKKYPVIDQTYTGPHTFMFPRTFTTSLQRSNQSIAELGFIVVAVDGMGTAGRSKAFHNVSYKNMGKNLTDHVLAIQQLGRKYSWMDTTRVGIFGHSAGGYDAGHAVLEFPDFYKVAVASSADHDFRMEKDWWPEMYMGWPVDSTYDQVSNITMAKNLKGKLLIVHGGLDENVNPSATFKLAEAFIKNDKEFDMLIIPSQHHGYTGKYGDYFTKKLWNYFIEHLGGEKTLWDFDLDLLD
jgi:dipeptidyl-peptidase-4